MVNLKFLQGAFPARQCLFLILLSSTAVSRCGAVRELYDRFYRNLNDSIPCFRLNNADSQIGCSGSDTNTRGVVHYVQSQSDVEWLLHSSTHPPYIALMEPVVFTSWNVPRLRDSSRVNGILLRYSAVLNDSIDNEYFSAERECPNKDFGVPGCPPDKPWNIYTNGTSLSFSDFGDFPIFAIFDHTFEDILECFDGHNANGSGGIADYPLCSAEMVADMLNTKDTASCFRRGKLLTMYVNGLEVCDPLGDKTVWGSMFRLEEERINNGSIMLATKLDSIAFFPYLSWGANNELAGVATLMAVLQTIGKLKADGVLIGTKRPILFAFFQGESWDYIGSSRMVYDMERGAFPDFTPRIRQDDITDFLELTNLGLSKLDNNGVPITYYHNKTLSPLLTRLIDLAGINASGVALMRSSREDLPVASLQRFLRRNMSFSGAVLSDFDNVFRNRFYGSRYDDARNFNANVSSDTEGEWNDTLGLVSHQLAALASLIAEAVVRESKPIWNAANYSADYRADPETIRNVLYCFLVNTACESFKEVLTFDKAQELEQQPLHRYVSVDTTTNSETIITHALLANLTGVKLGNGTKSMKCSDCSDLINELTKNDNQVTVEKLQYNKTEDLCYCVMSYVHYHDAVSPAFLEEDYTSQEYSTWVESRWRFISLRIYLVTYPLQEVAFFFCGLAMMFITLLVAVQGSRKSSKIFNTLSVAHSPLHLTAADRHAPPEPIDISDSENDALDSNTVTVQ